MSLKVAHLDSRHNADLYKILLKNKDVGGLQLIPKRDIFLNPPRGGAIAFIDNDVIKQVLLCEFKDDVCYTRGLFGEFGPHTLDVIDILCATCSSSDPLIEQHQMVIQSTQVDSFKALWPSTRLGMMTSEQIWNGLTFKAKITYRFDI